MYYVKFNYEDESYLAVGRDEHMLSVHIENEEGEYWRKPRMFWPSCLKFMDNEDVVIEEQGEVTVGRELERRYGRLRRRGNV